MSSGYVLDFTNATFGEFFRTEVGLDIYDEAYAFNGDSKGKRLRALVECAQPKAIVRALTSLWEYREDLRARDGASENVRDARKRLSAVIERLGGQSLPPSFDELPTPAVRLAVTTRPGTSELQALADEFISLHSMAARPRGFVFEKFLTKVFDAWGLEARDSFRNTGEQIDGSIVHRGTVYLLEAKWEESPIGARPLQAFQGMVGERLEGTRGIFISYRGFSPDGLKAFTARKVILMEGADLYHALVRGISLLDVIDAKVRYAAERRDAFARVIDLFPG